MEMQDTVGGNAHRSTRESLEPDSNVIVERNSQPPKQDSPSCSTEEGRHIAESDAQFENAPNAIRET
jgi:hypothetical protein